MTGTSNHRWNEYFCRNNVSWIGRSSKVIESATLLVTGNYFAQCGLHAFELMKYVHTLSEDEGRRVEKGLELFCKSFRKLRD